MPSQFMLSHHYGERWLRRAQGIREFVHRTS
jgi:hypothetical protein